VGDQSDFVTAMGRTLQELGPPLGAALPEHHFAFLCDKVRGATAEVDRLCLMLVQRGISLAPKRR
jgi:hypothetical protein